MGRSELVLAIETGTGCGSVALTRGGFQQGRLLAECTCQPEVSHSRRLLGSVEWLLNSTGMDWVDIDALAVSIGPGSFTGLRIGLAAAKGIAMATDLPVVGVPTLDALAQFAFFSDRLICCVLDARKQEVYAGFYRSDSLGHVSRIGQNFVISPAALVEMISEPVLLIGPGTELVREYVDKNENISIALPGFTLPSAAKVGFLGCDLFQKGDRLDPVTAGPMYIRASEAEINLQKKR